MRYTEQPSDVSLDSFYDWIRAAVILTLIGPLRLVKEISTKIIYLEQKIVKRILFTACILECFILILQIVITTVVFGQQFDMLVGKVPLLVHLIVFVMLCAGTYVYCVYDFIIYQQLSRFLPVVTGVNIANADTDNATEEVKDEDPLNNINSFEDLDDIINQATAQATEEDIQDTVETQEIDLSNLFGDLGEDFLKTAEPVEMPTADVIHEESTTADPLINEDIYENEDVFRFQNSLDLKFDGVDESQLEYSGNLKQEEKDNIVQNMQNSREPSKYISEDNFALFLNKIGVDNFGTIDDLSSWCTPKDFALAT